MIEAAQKFDPAYNSGMSQRAGRSKRLHPRSLSGRSRRPGTLEGTGVTDLLASAMSIILAAEAEDEQHRTQHSYYRMESCAQHLAAQEERESHSARHSHPRVESRSEHLVGQNNTVRLRLANTEVTWHVKKSDPMQNKLRGASVAQRFDQVTQMQTQYMCRWLTQGSRYTSLTNSPPRQLSQPRQLRLPRYLGLRRQLHFPRNLSLRGHLGLARFLHRPSQLRFPRNLHLPSQVRFPRNLSQPRHLHLPRYPRPLRHLNLPRYLRPLRHLNLPRHLRPPRHLYLPRHLCQRNLQQLCSLLRRPDRAPQLQRQPLRLPHMMNFMTSKLLTLSCLDPHRITLPRGAISCRHRKNLCELKLLGLQNRETIPARQEQNFRHYLPYTACQEV